VLTDGGEEDDEDDEEEDEEEDDEEGEDVAGAKGDIGVTGPMLMWCGLPLCICRRIWSSRLPISVGGVYSPNPPLTPRTSDEEGMGSKGPVDRLVNGVDRLEDVDKGADTRDVGGGGGMRGVGFDPPCAE